MTDILLEHSNDCSNDDECCICLNNKVSSHFKCIRCKKSLVCVECFHKVSNDVFNEKTNNMILNYKCPVCRFDGIYGYENFEKFEIIEIVKKHLSSIMKSKNTLHIYRDDNNLNKLEETNRHLIKENNHLKDLLMKYSNKLTLYENNNNRK